MEGSPVHCCLLECQSHATVTLITAPLCFECQKPEELYLGGSVPCTSCPLRELGGTEVDQHRDQCPGKLYPEGMNQAPRSLEPRHLLTY